MGSRSRIFWWGMASALGILIGAFSPWASWSVTRNGTDGPDGWLVVLLAVLGGVLVSAGRTRRSASMLVVATGAAAAAIAVYDRSNLTAAARESQAFATLQVGWGLNLAIVGSLSLALQGSVGVLAHRSRAARAHRATG